MRLLWLTADGRAPNGLVADASLRQFIALERAELLVIVGSVKRWPANRPALKVGEPCHRPKHLILRYR